MSDSLPDLDVHDMIAVLATGADLPLSPGLPVSQLDHALQTAALLAHLDPGDDELAVAGLVHDIGHLLPGGSGWRERWASTWRPSVISWRPTPGTAGCSPTTAWCRWVARAAP